MRTDVTRQARIALFVLALGVLGVLPQAGHAQQSDGPSLFLVDTDTRIQKLRWSFPSGSALPTSRLETQIALRGPGSLVWAKRAFDFIPFVPSPDYAPFSPVVLQRDVVRLRRLYRNAGFPSVAVDYDVALDTTVNRVAVTMIVDQGEPLTIDTVAISVTNGPTDGPGDGGGGTAGRAIEIPDDLRQEWESFRSTLAAAEGRRFSQEERSRLVQETRNWFSDRGYPWVEASLVRADTSGTRVSVALEARAGARARVGEVRIEGNERLEPPVLRREIPIRIGDWYSARRVSEGQRELFELDLIRRALGDLVESQPQDTSVVVRYRLNEGRPRLIWGRVGWRSESGVGGEAHWQHRNFYGGARTLTLSSNFESGWGALEATNTRSVGLSALVRQPYLFQRTISGTFGPFARFRDDFRDRSLLYGVETSAIYRVRPLETVTAQHELSRLRVDDTYQLTPLSEVIAQGDSVFAPIFVKSIFRLRGAYGTLDDRINPNSGYLLEPSLEVTGPSGISDVEFFRISIQGMAARRLNSDFTLYLRGTAGRLFPFGESDPESGVSRTRAIVGLRDVMFTAGGTSDVRGWANGLMGSKIPDVDVDGNGVVVADRFVPAGGLVRLTGTTELGMPFPFLSDSHRTYAFFDAGRVWSPGETFDPGDPELRRESWAYAVGGGFEFGTLVGPIRIGVGYKLNPIAVDLLSPGVVARAIVDGVPLDQLEPQSYRRWHLHLSIGRGF
ncbi:MAG: BamA/TamA family outer membrane protein [Gemmatimonadetes bacterium]|nr:BamA/TamA family outer membrane protein [Gemmatimonadota bacterium]